MNSKKTDTTNVAQAFNLSYKDTSEVQKKISLSYLKEINIFPDSKILDIGCGDGKITKFMAEKFSDCSVTGMDVSEELIFHAKNNHKANNLQFLNKDLRDLSEIDKYNHIFSFFVLHWINNSEKQPVYLNLLKSLKKGGKYHFIIPLEHLELLEIRREALLHFADIFKNYEIAVIEDNASVYLQIFDFIKQSIDINETKRDERQHDFNFTPFEFTSFYSSFASELRDFKLSGTQRQAYLDWIVDKFPKKENGCVDFQFKTITLEGTISSSPL